MAHRSDLFFVYFLVKHKFFDIKNQVLHIWYEEKKYFKHLN